MSQSIKKVIYIYLIVSMAVFSFSCGKRTKSWKEPGSKMIDESITPGVHPERGSISDAVPIYNATIYVPLGMQETEVIDVDDKTGMPIIDEKTKKAKKSKRIKRDYKVVTYEMNELTPENIDAALKYYGVLGEDAEFYSFEKEDYNGDGGLAEPGGTGKLDKKGIVSYVNFISSAIDNSSEYEGKGLNAKDLIGKIDQTDIEYCIIETFASNFKLATCEIKLVDANGNVLDSNN